MIFSLSPFTTGTGLSNTLGVAFSVIDQEGVILASINWSSPQIPNPGTTTSYTIDLSSLNYAFLFQTYQISAAIQDQNSTVYTIPPIYKKICQPNDFQESGYVCGMFQLRADCTNNDILVKEFTVFVYNNLTPQSIFKTGTLNYPTGTIPAVSFSVTPFINSVVYTGRYMLSCTSIATYNLQDDTYVLVSYVTNQQFDITCSNKVSDLLCCIEDLYRMKIKNYDNALGKRAAQQLDEVELPFFLGLGQEMNGMDSEWAYQSIKKQLNCNCGPNAMGQNEPTPLNPSVTNIVLTGAGGTSVPSPTVVGNTKTFAITSSIYQVVNGNGDNTFSVTVNTATANTVKYIITFNYANLSSAILTAIGASPTLTAQLNALISATVNIDLTNLDGKCIIDLSSVNYFLSILVPGANVTINNIIVGSTTYNAPAGLLVSNITGVEAWLNGLSVGSYEVAFDNSSNGSYFSVLTNANTFGPVSMSLSLSSGNTVIFFQKTNKSVIAFLQAMVDYICQITAAQVGIGNNLALCYFDYNGDIQTTNLTAANKQNDFNVAAVNSICNLANRINTITGVTCAKLQALFPLNSAGSFGNSDVLYGTLGGSCAGLTDLQIANLVIAAVSKYTSVKTAWCAINCTTPGSCAEISAINVSAVNTTTIGVYGVTWQATPNSSQTVTVQYRPTGTTAWLTSTSNLTIGPNGTITGTSPYVIGGLTAGTTYDIGITNNCGGNQFVNQVTTPATPVVSGSYRLDTVIANICPRTPVTLYSSTNFGTGVTLYQDAGLTTPVTTFTYVATASGAIYNLNSSTGLVGANTGSNCTTGTAGTYVLGNSTSTICSGSSVTLYTNGNFSVGLTLYTDSALTNPQTGSTYVVYSGVIYNLNSSTGLIGSSTGLSCTPSISGTTSYSTSVPNGSGTISAPVGMLVTVTVNASGPPGGTYTMECNVSGEGTVIASNGSNTLQFVMPVPGSVSFTGIYTSSNSSGGGSISVS
jgi:hypothetical protein